MNVKRDSCGKCGVVSVISLIGVVFMLFCGLLSEAFADVLPSGATGNEAKGLTQTNADEVFWCDFPATLENVKLPSAKFPIKRYIRVEQRGILDVKGRIVLSNATNDIAKAACMYVRFSNRLGRDVLVEGQGLRYSTLYKCGFVTFQGGARPTIFNMSIKVPDTAVLAEIGIASLSAQHSVEMSRFICSYSPSGIWRPKMKIVSILFLAFVAIVFAVYFLAPARCSPWVLFAASIVFYSFFNVYSFFFLGASAFSIWLGGLWLHNDIDGRRWIKLALLICFNVGILLVVKYFVPAVNGIYDMLDDIAPTISIVLPLGVSFYTLQAVSYGWDVYRKDLQPERNFFKLFHYLIFFPTIMQGPISRYGQIGRQLWTPHGFSWDRMRSGLELMLWGFFKKMVIADRAAMLANSVFAPGSMVSGIPALLGVFCYSIQIYADFSGCVDICRGISEVLGIDLVNNFRHPYFSTSIKDFWRRWHISLSSWLRDYVYIPLGGNRKGVLRKYLNILIVFGVSGIWHGVGINFFIWGLLHGLYQILDGITLKFREWAVAFLGLSKDVFSFRFGQRIWTFVLVSFAWIFFRAPTLNDAWSVVKRLFVFNPWTLTDGTYLKHGLDAKDFDVLVVSLIVLLVVSMMQEKGSVRQMLKQQALWFRWSIYLLAVFGTLIFGIYGPGYDAAEFIYMQF